MDVALSVALRSGLGGISYSQSIFFRAICYIDHSLLTPDTNAVENAIWPFVAGRKNWLFSGSPGGFYASAGIYSLIGTVKANSRDPYHYLCYIFDRLPACRTHEERQALLPYEIKPEELADIRGN